MGKVKKIGIDIGGVIIDRIANDGTDTSFMGERYLQTTAVGGALETIAIIAREVFGPENVFIVSKCGKTTERKSREWLEAQHFHKTTGILPKQVYFCRKRHEKAPICIEIGITHFVDDRLEVLGYMPDSIRRFLFRADSREVARHKQHLGNVTSVASWGEVLQLLQAE
jgi:hypothetical protein